MHHLQNLDFAEITELCKLHTDSKHKVSLFPLQQATIPEPA